MNGWQRFGDPSRFAIEFKFIPDPDAGQGSQPALSASWGRFRLWVRGRNLCEHHAQGELRTELTWYLLPLFGWLADNWDPLFHEHRLPEAMEANSARHAYLLGLRATLGDTDPQVEDRAEAWQRWWHRHSLRSCRHGGLFPDVFIRRMLDFVEISWGNQVLPGAPSDFYFTAPFHAVYLDVANVAEPLYQALEAVIHTMEDQLGVTQAAEIAALHLAVQRITETAPDQREKWYLYGEPDQLGGNRSIHTVLSTALGRLRQAASTLTEGTLHPLCIQQLSPAVAMFGSATPSIGEADAALLTQALLGAFTKVGAPTANDSFVQDHPLSAMNAAYDEGYDLALELLETLDLPSQQAQSIDMAQLLQDLEITVAAVDLEDGGLRGVALAGPDLRPTILVNNRHPMNQREPGRRFTLAHELCHVLHDRGYARRVCLVSGPWAPPGVERRANAFAAMLLMPPELVNRHIAALPSSSLDNVDAIQQMARRMATGFLATLEHLTNIGKLSEYERDLVRAEAWRRSGFDA